jgi:hypothetical protein
MVQGKRLLQLTVIDVAREGIQVRGQTKSGRD